jgi:hypothetical protein
MVTKTHMVRLKSQIFITPSPSFSLKKWKFPSPPHENKKTFFFDVFFFASRSLSYMCTLKYRNALRGIPLSFCSLMSVSFVKVMRILLPYRKFYVISSGKKYFGEKKNVQKTKLYFLMSHVSHEGECLACSKKLKFALFVCITFVP